MTEFDQESFQSSDSNNSGSLTLSFSRSRDQPTISEDSSTNYLLTTNGSIISDNVSTIDLVSSISKYKGALQQVPPVLEQPRFLYQMLVPSPCPSKCSFEVYDMVLVEFPRKVIAAVTDGLWLIDRANPLECISSDAGKFLCINGFNNSLYVTGGDSTAVRLYSLGEVPPRAMGKFEVAGAGKLCGIAAAPSGLIAISDSSLEQARVTVHDQGGSLLFEISGIFKGCQPVQVSWADDHRICVIVTGDLPEHQRALFVDVDTKEVLWQSESLIGAWLLNCVGDSFYVSHRSLFGHSSKTVTVLSSNSGKRLRNKEITCHGNQFLRVYKEEEEKYLIALSFNKGLL